MSLRPLVDVDTMMVVSGLGAAPERLILLQSNCGQEGDTQQAALAMQLDPEFASAHAAALIWRPDHLARFTNGLRLAGLPE